MRWVLGALLKPSLEHSLATGFIKTGEPLAMRSGWSWDTWFSTPATLRRGLLVEAQFFGKQPTDRAHGSLLWMPSLATRYTQSWVARKATGLDESGPGLMSATRVPDAVPSVHTSSTPT